MVVAWLLIAGCNSEPEPVVPPGAAGSFVVGHTTFEATDASRKRTLPVDVWYPAEGDGDGLPAASYALAPGFDLPSEVALANPPVSQRRKQTLVVFSHGYGGINTQSVSLMEALASHGFVVAAPEHVGNAQGSLTDDFDTAAGNRVPDVRFLIDEMLAGGPSGRFAGRLDPAAVGVAGHSFGGMTAIGSAAGWAGTPGDPRVAAIAPISAVVRADLQEDLRSGSNAGFRDADLARIAVPVLLVGGTKDVDVPIENNDIAFAAMTGAPVVYQVDIHGANHTHFANVCDIGDLLIERGIDQDRWASLGATDLIEPYDETCTGDAFPVEEVDRLLNVYTVAFFKKHLLGQAAYGRWLKATYADGEPDVTFARR